MLGQMPALNSRNVSVARTIHKVPVGFIARKYLLSVLPNLMRLWASKMRVALHCTNPEDRVLCHVLARHAQQVALIFLGSLS